METTGYKDLRIGQTLRENRTLLPDVSSESMIYSLINQSRAAQRLVRHDGVHDRMTDNTDLAIGEWIEFYCVVGMRFPRRGYTLEAMANVGRLFDALIVTNREVALGRVAGNYAKHINWYDLYRPKLKAKNLNYDIVLLDNFQRDPLKADWLLSLGGQYNRHETFVIVNIE